MRKTFLEPKRLKNRGTFAFMAKAICLFLFWILLTAKIDLIHLSMGALSVWFLLQWFSSPSPPRGVGSDWKRRFQIGISGLRYGLWLFTRIWLAGWHMTKIILHPHLPLKPRLVRHQTILNSEWEKVIFGNSITLTPGTITADLEGPILTIHTIDDASFEDIRTHTMEREIAKIFGSSTPEAP